MSADHQDAFVGVDVAFANKKVLPVSVCIRPSGRALDILPLRVSFEKPPAGRGNVLALDDLCAASSPRPCWIGLRS
jgi:hypothetical protein